MLPDGLCRCPLKRPYTVYTRTATDVFQNTASNFCCSFSMSLVYTFFSVCGNPFSIQMKQAYYSYSDIRKFNLINSYSTLFCDFIGFAGGFCEVLNCISLSVLVKFFHVWFLDLFQKKTNKIPLVLLKGYIENEIN